MYVGIHVKWPTFVSEGNRTIRISRQIFVKVRKIRHKEFRPVRTALAHAERRTDGRTDMTNVISALGIYANVRVPAAITLLFCIFIVDIIIL